MATIAIRVLLAVAILLAAVFFFQAQRWNSLGSEYEKLYGAGKYDDALNVVMKQFDVCAAMFIFGKYFMPFSLNNLGNIYYGKDDFVQSQHYYEKAVVAAEAVFGPRSKKLLPLFENLVRLHKTTGNQDQEQQYLDRIALITKRAQ
jgi:hypothetical protein